MDLMKMIESEMVLRIGLLTDKGIEPQGGYKRVKLRPGSKYWFKLKSDDDIIIQNKNDINFPRATKDWGMIVGFFIITPMGEIVAQGNFNIPKMTVAGDKRKIMAGQLELKYWK